MTETITPELFDHLVRLAALELEPDEAEYLRDQLNKQLKSIEELLAIPIPEGIPAAAHGVAYTPQNSPPVRADEWRPEPQPEAILAQAPEIEEGYIVVPEIPHTELS
jgi:aspartyl/glutamyl-tRNA(Asn/Gln) amidotransferase C subunit